MVWTSEHSLGGTIGDEWDILMCRSVDDGLTWSAAAPVNANAAGDTGDDLAPCVVIDSAVTGVWTVLWHANSNINGTGTDNDILMAHSSDAGLTWCAPAAFNANAGLDASPDEQVDLALDPAGAWVAVWQSRDSMGGTTGTDGDLLHARFALPDCNANAIPDSIEPDDNNNGVPDECDDPTPACPADIAPASKGGDGQVNVSDLLTVINSWGAGQGDPADINGDGTVNVADLLAVINAWGPCP